LWKGEEQVRAQVCARPVGAVAKPVRSVSVEGRVRKPRHVAG